MDSAITPHGTSCFLATISSVVPDDVQTAQMVISGAQEMTSAAQTISAVHQEPLQVVKEQSAGQQGFWQVISAGQEKLLQVIKDQAKVGSVFRFNMSEFKPPPI